MVYLLTYLLDGWCEVCGCRKETETSVTLTLSSPVRWAWHGHRLISCCWWTVMPNSSQTSRTSTQSSSSSSDPVQPMTLTLTLDPSQGLKSQ